MLKAMVTWGSLIFEKPAEYANVTISGIPSWDRSCWWPYWPSLASILGQMVEFFCWGDSWFSSCQSGRKEHRTRRMQWGTRWPLPVSLLWSCGYHCISWWYCEFLQCRVQQKYQISYDFHWFPYIYRLFTVSKVAHPDGGEKRSQRPWQPASSVSHRASLHFLQYPTGRQCSRPKTFNLYTIDNNG